LYHHCLHSQEFEIIAQIKLLQEAAKNYLISPDEEFRHWFDNIKTFSEAERLVKFINVSTVMAGEVSKCF